MTADKRLFFALLAMLLFPQSLLADDKTLEIKFDTLDQLGVRAKPTAKIDDVQEALDFILADKLVRENIWHFMQKGYTSWKAVAEAEDEGVWVVRVISNSALPPYNCFFRFDSIGNDKRDIPGNGCKYE